MTQALAGVEADFNLRLVEPTAVLGGVVDRKSSPQVAASDLPKMIGERLFPVRIQVIDHQRTAG